MILYGICLNQTKGRILKPKSSNSSTNLILRKQKRQMLLSNKNLQSAVFCPQIFLKNPLGVRVVCHPKQTKYLTLRHSPELKPAASNVVDGL